LKQSTTAADIARASATAVFYRLAKILELLETVTARPRHIIVSGGIARSKASLQLLADSLGRDVDLAADQEASLRGAAIYGFNQLGMTLPTRPSRTIIRHDKALAADHGRRRTLQDELARSLTNQP
jgi:sugar (pentulose or hexulose) kinase